MRACLCAIVSGAGFIHGFAELHRRLGERARCGVDVFDIGVVLLELFSGALSTETKNKKAFAQIESAKSRMGDKPIPLMIKAMLCVDPQARWAVPRLLAETRAEERAPIDPKATA